MTGWQSIRADKSAQILSSILVRSSHSIDNNSRDESKTVPKFIPHNVINAENSSWSSFQFLNNSNNLALVHTFEILKLFKC